MANNTDTEVPSQQREDDSGGVALALVLVVVGFVGLIIMIAVADSSHTKRVESSAATAESEPRPPLWTISADLDGRVAFGVNGLTMPHYLNVSMGNYDCVLGEDRRRCCHAVVRFDGSPDAEQADRLCADLQSEALVRAAEAVSSDLLDEFVGHDRFDLLYRQRFDGEPNDRRTSTTFVNHR